MTDQPKPLADKQSEDLLLKDVQSNLPQRDRPNARPLQNFLSGFFLSGIIVFAFVSLSLYYTHTPLLELGLIKLAIAAVIPLAVGCLSMASKGKLVDYLADMGTSAQLPF